MSGTIVVDLPDLGRAPVRLALRIAAGTIPVDVGITGAGGAWRVSGAATLEVTVATGSLVTVRAPGALRGE